MFCEAESPNLHRHQQNKKQKKTGTMGPLLSSCWIFFFCLFGACRCLVHLVFFFCYCLSMFCEVRVTKPAQAKKRKYPGPMGSFLSSCWTLCFFSVSADVWCIEWFGFVFFNWCLSMFCEVRVTKPAQAKKRKYPGPMGPFLSSCWTLCFFSVSADVWCIEWFGFVFFNWCLSMFCEVRVTKPAQTPKKKTKH